jgi:hypothetical protein
MSKIGAIFRVKKRRIGGFKGIFKGKANIGIIFMQTLEIEMMIRFFEFDVVMM